MGKLKVLMAKRCDLCPLCTWARANPENKISRVVQLHGKFCPFWRAWQDVYGNRVDEAAR